MEIVENKYKKLGIEQQLNLILQNQDKILSLFEGRELNSKKEDELISVKQAAERFDVHERTIRKRLREGALEKHDGVGKTKILISANECKRLKNINALGYKRAS